MSPPSGSITRTSGPRLNWAVLAALRDDETDVPIPSASDEPKASMRSMPG